MKDIIIYCLLLGIVATLVVTNAMHRQHIASIHRRWRIWTLLNYRGIGPDGLDWLGRKPTTQATFPSKKKPVNVRNLRRNLIPD